MKERKSNYINSFQDLKIDFNSLKDKFGDQNQSFQSSTENLIFNIVKPYANDLKGLEIKLKLYLVFIQKNILPDNISKVTDNWDYIKKNNKEVFSEFNDLFNELYLKSDKFNYYWSFCSLKAYKANLKSQYLKFKENKPESELEDFIRKEKQFYKKQTSSLIFRFFTKNNIEDQVIKSIEKKNIFLDKNDDVKSIIFNDIKIVEDSVDLSSLNLTGRIIALNELGIIDYLKNKYEHFNDNKIASILSSFTGMKQSTIYPYIHTIYQDGVDQKTIPIRILTM